MTLNTAISRHIWDIKYRLKTPDGTPLDTDLDATWMRIAKALAAAEKPEHRSRTEALFLEALRDCKFLPAGRIIAGAGTERDVTLFNCFVMGSIPDDMGGIFAALREAALTMQAGGGIGYDFSTLRPQGRTRPRRRRRRLRTAFIHGRLGLHVPHHHERRPPPRRHDGNPPLRSSRH